MPKLTLKQEDEKYKQLVKIAETRGGEVLFDKWPGAKSKVRWRCNCGCEWLATPNYIQNGTWCPECSSGLSERICKSLFERLLGKTFRKLRPSWLMVDGKRLELDGYCPELKLAFEHNGLQHYRAGLFCDDLKKRQFYDSEKKRLCAQNDIQLIVVPALFALTPLEELKTLVVSELDKCDIFVPNPGAEVKYVSGFVDYKKQLLEIKEIAAGRGGKCTSTHYLGWNKKLNFVCKCGYTWKATPSAIKRGTWCPACAKRPLITIGFLQDLAKSKNGILLSTKYINNHSKLKWQCSKSHVWYASYNTIQKHWCPKCSIKQRSDKKRKPIDVYQEAARSKGGNCLSTNVSSCYDKLEFECGYGHRWSGRADQIKNTKQWCPKCARLKRKKE